MNLDAHTRVAELAEPAADGRVRCLACGHRCAIAEGYRGVCQVRHHRAGALWAPWGYVQSECADPIEKKPFFHVVPGCLAYSFGMFGCDLHCPYCQNWTTAQILDGGRLRETEPEALVARAVASGARSLISTYNEPLITAEWAMAIFRFAKAAGLLTGFVSNGNATPRVLEFLRPRTDLYKVDLKCFNDAGYRQLGGRLETVLDSIRRIHELGFWMEIVTLVTPGFNDSDDELRRIASFIASVSPAIPWHVTAFHPDYRMLDRGATEARALERAAAIGRDSGLAYVYAGNARMGDLENTRCAGCRSTVIRRRGFRVIENRIAGGRCPQCDHALPGVWC